MVLKYMLVESLAYTLIANKWQSWVEIQVCVTQNPLIDDLQFLERGVG